MKIEVDHITVTMTVHEARIIEAFMQHFDADDQHGDTADTTGENIDLVVRVCSEFRDGLKRRISS